MAVGGVAGAAVPASALVRWNDGREQIFLNLEANLSWESNIFATADGEGDYMAGFTAGIDYQRRAGLIGIDASMNLASVRFDEHSDENFLNPNLSVELAKESGRTTGSISLRAARESRADSAANLRTESWNYSAGLNWKYPVIERYSVAGNFSYSLRDFANNTVLVDLAAYAASVDLFYVYTSERDLVAGYQYRQSESSSGVDFHDHGFTVGVIGKVLPKVNGSLRAGYQLRTTSGEAAGLEFDDYDSWTLSASSTWTVSQQINVTADLSKDFFVSSTDVSVDTMNGSLEAQYTMGGSMSLSAGVNYATSKFLGVLGNGRHDTTFGFNASLGRTFGKVRAGLSYSYNRNWSTIEYADFDRQSVSVTFGTRM